MSEKETSEKDIIIEPVRDRNPINVSIKSESDVNKKRKLEEEVETKVEDVKIKETKIEDIKVEDIKKFYANFHGFFLEYRSKNSKESHINIIIEHGLNRDFYFHFIYEQFSPDEQQEFIDQYNQKYGLLKNGLLKNIPVDRKQVNTYFVKLSKYIYNYCLGLHKDKEESGSFRREHAKMFYSFKDNLGRVCWFYDEPCQELIDGFVKDCL